MRRSNGSSAGWLGATPVATLLLVACPGGDADDADTTTDALAGSSTAPAGSSAIPDATTSSGPDPTTTATATTTPADDTTAGTEAGPLQVVMETTLGQIVLELDEASAPVTAENFLAYVNAGFYDGTDGQGATIVHRVIPGFVIQGGGYTEALSLKPTADPIVNEFGNGLLNVRGSISMARTDDPDSATSQFFLNLVDNPDLDNPPGYAVFGQVVEGLEVMDAIAAVATNGSDVPIEPISILSTTVR